jgi:salicylate hydroxylase
MVETELLSLGIRRWKYQQVLYEACQSVGIVIHFGKRLQSISAFEKDGDINSLLTFKDGSAVTASLVIGADGINSKVRNYVVNPSNDPEASQKIEEYVPEYTGVTCLMGCANVPRIRGICFPSSATTKCHACYYPTLVPEHDGEGNTLDDQQYEQVFQIYFPSPIERPDTWRTLTPEEAKVECRDLAKKLREDGWDEQFLKPLESETLNGVLRVGLRSREALDFWHVGGENNSSGAGARAVLLGDAAHPPVPYIGQGAMMAMEDAGTLSLLLSRYCPIDKKKSGNTTAPATIDYTHFHKAMKTYESLRVARTRAILGSSVQLGQTQQKRAESKLYNAFREWSIKAQVWAHGTLPVMRPGAAFDYVQRVKEVLREDTNTD